MNSKVRKVYEETYDCFKRKYHDDNKAWDRFIDFMACDHFLPLMSQINHGFKDIMNDTEFISELKKVYDPGILKTDMHDYLGDMYLERQGVKQVQRKGQFLTPDNVAEMVANMTIGKDISRRVNILDPCVGTGRLLMAAYKVNKNSNLFGVDIDMNALKIAYVNFRIHGIKDFYLLHADSLLHETDISKPEGSYNWQFANQWNSHITELKEIGSNEKRKQLEMALN